MRVSVDDEQVSARTLLILTDAAEAAGIPRPRVLQGSWSAGDLSAGTHAGGGAVDWSVKGLTPAQQLAFNTELRRRNGCAWLRTRAYGWTKGDHGHAIIRDEPGLSAPAKAQVVAYDLGLNGLVSKAKDPHPRPTQRPVEEIRLMAWTIGKPRMVKPKGDIEVTGGRWVELARLDLPKGGSYSATLQVRMPRGVGAGEAVLARVGWGEAGPGELDETGGNPVPPASAVRRWRTPIQGHSIVGGGPLAYRLWLPPGTHKVRFVAKAVRTA